MSQPSVTSGARIFSRSILWIPRFGMRYSLHYLEVFMVHFVALERLVDHFLTLKNNSINFLVLIFVLGMVIKLEMGLMPKIQSFHSDNVVVVNEEGFFFHKVSLICSTWKWRNIFKTLTYSVILFHVMKLTFELFIFPKKSYLKFYKFASS